MKIDQKLIFDHLASVMDPELNIDIVKLGLIYDVSIQKKQTASGSRQHIHITMTLTTPGCPLAAVFDPMVRSALSNLPGIDNQEDITIELTFDPPWIPDMMDEEARAELGLN